MPRTRRGENSFIFYDLGVFFRGDGIIYQHDSGSGFQRLHCNYLSGWCRYGNGIDKLQEPADLQDHLFTALAFSYSSLSVVTTVTCMTSTLKPLPDGPGDSIRRSSLFALQSQRLSLLNLAPTLKPRSTCSEACIGSMLPYSCFSGCALLMLRLTGK